MNVVRVGLVLAIAIAGVSLALSTPDAEQYGYVVFTPSEGDAQISSGAGIGLRLTSCIQTKEGLRVRGWVGPPQGGPRQIEVTGAPGTRAGVTAGSAYAAHTRRWPGAAPGDFDVVIPWATTSSVFRFTQAGVLGSSNSERPDDPVPRTQNCPIVEVQ